MNPTALTMVCSAIVGVVFLQRYPFPGGDPLLVLVHLERPYLFELLRSLWTAMLFTTPAIGFSALFSLVFIFGRESKARAAGKLPPFPEPGDSVQVVLGEVHHERNTEPAEFPQWRLLPDRGLFTGIAVFGAIGTGKTSACLRPYAHQLLSYRAADNERRIGGLVLEVKGDFCHQVRTMLEECDRPSDYLEISMDSGLVYNPLHNDLDAFALAYSIASLLNNLYGRGKEPFWQQAYTNLVKFIILLHKVVDGYVTLFDVYVCAINPQALAEKVRQGEAMFEQIANAPSAWLSIDPMVYMAHDELSRWKWDTLGDRMRTAYEDEIAHLLDSKMVPYTVETPEVTGGTNDLLTRLAQFAAVKRWLTDDWGRLDRKLQSSIVEGVSVFLSLFDDNPRLKEIFCPPKEAYDPELNKDGRYGRPVPAFADLIESGKLLALNFPIGANAATSRAVGCMMKQDFQRAVLGRIPLMAACPDKHFREVLFLCDEYQSFATVGESDPAGDEKFFALSRQAKCIAIVATQSISSLAATLSDASCKTLLQTFRTKLFLATADPATAKIAAELCGREEQLVASYSISESGHDVSVSMLSGRAQADKAGVMLNKSYSMQVRPVFEAKEFTDMKNAQCIALVYDGVNPLPAHRLFLKPHYLDPALTYFEQRDKGLL